MLLLKANAPSPGAVNGSSRATSDQVSFAFESGLPIRYFEVTGRSSCALPNVCGGCGIEHLERVRLVFLHLEISAAAEAIAFRAFHFHA